MKILIHFLFFLVPVFLSFFVCCGTDSEDTHKPEKLVYPASIDYWAYIPPGCSPSDRNTEKIKEYSQKLEEETLITLNTHIQKSELGKETNFIRNINNSIKDKTPPDLVYTESRYVIDQLLQQELVVQTDELLKEHTQYIYRSFPEAFWNYRNKIGMTRSIPLHSYTLRFPYGFWVIKKQFLQRQKLKIETRKDLLTLLTKCEKPDPEDRKNWYRNCCSDLAVLLSDWNNTDPFGLLASLFGMEFMDRRVILFDHSRNVWKMVSQLDQEQSEMITTIASLDLVTMRASYENLTRIPWSVLHIPYHVSFYPITKYQLEKMQELFQSEDYIIINDIDLTDQIPSERIRRCFILENDENSINALKILDGLLQTNIPLEIFLLENKADKKIGEIKLHEIKNILFNPTAMRYDFRRSYGCFINTKNIPVYNIFPPDVSVKYREYLNMIQENMGMNSYSDYQDVMKRRNLLRTVIVRHKEETYEYDEWSEIYPSILSNNDIINILTDGNYKESILRPYMQIVQELIINLQERTDLFLKLSM